MPVTRERKVETLERLLGKKKVAALMAGVKEGRKEMQAYKTAYKDSRWRSKAALDQGLLDNIAESAGLLLEDLQAAQQAGSSDYDQLIAQVKPLAGTSSTQQATTPPPAPAPAPAATATKKKAPPPVIMNNSKTGTKQRGRELTDYEKIGRLLANPGF